MIETVQRPVRQVPKQMPKEHLLALRTSKPLAYELHATGTPKFDRDTVKAYQIDKLYKLQHPPELWEHQKGLWVARIGSLLTISAAVWIYTQLSHWWLIGLIPVTVIAIIALFVHVPEEPQRHKDAEWLQSEYDPADPDFDLRVPPAIALQVSELAARLPTSKFVVHHFYKDPFMEVIYENPLNKLQVESEFIGFWDEDGFVH